MSYVAMIIGVSVVIVILFLIRLYFILISARCKSKVTLSGKTALITGGSSVYFILISARCESKVTLLGKTALFTGGSSGLGHQIAIELASRGCQVILAQRSTDETLRVALINETNNQNITLEYVDMSSFQSVRDLVGRLKIYLDKLDILINNAGVGNSLNTLTKDGFTYLWQINYYSQFLLTYLLVDLLKQSKSGRIIFTSSVLAHFHSMSVRNIENNRIKSKIKFLDYPNSKFLVILAADFFAQKLKKFNITCNSYHPGIVDTPIFKKTAQHHRGMMDRIALMLTIILKIFTKKTLEEGAQTALQLAVANEVADVTGQFFGETTRTCKPHGAKNKILRESVWKATEFAVSLKQEELLK